MEVDATVLYEVTFEQLIATQRAMIEYKTMYLAAMKELEELKMELSTTE
ncbi:MAG: hypothetical protein ACRCX8_16460 [Sarcina sp.]